VFENYDRKRVQKVLVVSVIGGLRRRREVLRMAVVRSIITKEESSPAHCGGNFSHKQSHFPLYHIIVYYDTKILRAQT